MKRAPLAFVAALSLFYLAMASSERIAPADVVLPLDFTGVDTLQLRSANAGVISISATRPAQASHDNRKGSTLRASRHGSLLRIEASLPEYESVEIVIPPTVRTIVTGWANISTEKPIDVLRIASTGAVTWEGPVSRLHIEEVAGLPPCGRGRGCDRDIGIQSGAIGELFVSSSAGVVSLMHSDDIGSARVLLGPDASLSLGHASRLDNIHLLERTP